MGWLKSGSVGLGWVRLDWTGLGSFGFMSVW